MDDPTVIVPRYERPHVFDGRPPRAPRRRRWGLRLLLVGAVGALLGSVALLAGLAVVSRDLPPLERLRDYRGRAPQATVVYGANGEVVGRFARERRTVVEFEAIPKVMIDAVVASEDAGYFEHEGVDYLGIARCVVKNLLSGRKRCGGSTITQQTVKTFFLSSEKTYVRKLRELVLAKRVEESLTKQHILYLYLNQIYFGHGAYGVQEAAKIYFGKDVQDIDLAEAALLAGLPQSPSRLDPFRHPDRAKNRRHYVLGRMRELGMIDDKRHAEADEERFDLAWEGVEAYLDNETHFMSEIRRRLLEDPRVGEELLLSGGLSIQTGLDPKLQAAADAALTQGVEAIDKRQGYRGPLLHLDPKDAKALRDLLGKRLEAVDPPRDDDVDPDVSPIVFDLSPLERAAKGLEPRELAELARTPRFFPDRVYAGIVTEVIDGRSQAVVTLGAVKVVLPMRSGLGWARPFDIARWTRRPRRPSEVLKAGDVVRVRALQPLEGGDPRRWSGKLEQVPLTQAAVVVIDPRTREVRALSGGYGTGAGTFNRAVQARRQAGSTFKPFVYAAAFETRDFTPVSECLDAPRTFYDPYLGRKWEPKNYGGRFDGRISLRKALTLSKNLCSVRLIEHDGVGPVRVTDVARRLGVTSELPNNLTLALGSGAVAPIEMVNAYASLAAGGVYDDAVFIRRVEGPKGDVLFEHQPQPRPALDPAVAYIVTSMMQSVVEEGTARAVSQLDRPIAGKTGTTNDSRDAWFIGFTPSLAAGVWVGFDDNRPLGPGETGGRAAIPIWLDTVRAAVEGQEPEAFVAPSSVVFASVDPESGKLAPPGYPDARVEPFLPGTEPTEILDPSAPPPSDDVLYER